MLAAFFLTPFEIIGAFTAGVAGLVGSLMRTNHKRNQPRKGKKGKRR